MAHHLVVANQTPGGWTLVEVVEERVRAAGGGEFTVVVPLTAPEHHAPTWRVPLDAGLHTPVVAPDSARGLLAIDRAHRATEQRLQTVLGRIRATGAAAAGWLGDPDPLVTVETALSRVDPEEIILATLPASVSRWLGMDLPSQLRRRTELPVTVVEAVEQSPHLEDAGPPTPATTGP